MSCEHKWEVIETKKKFERGRRLAGYSGYSGWGGANTEFYRDGDEEYLIKIEKCTECGVTKETKTFVTFHEEYYD